MHWRPPTHRCCTTGSASPTSPTSLELHEAGSHPDGRGRGSCSAHSTRAARRSRPRSSRTTLDVRRRVQQPRTGAGAAARQRRRLVAHRPHQAGGRAHRLPARAARPPPRPARGGRPASSTRSHSQAVDARGHAVGRHHLPPARAALDLRPLPRRFRRGGRAASRPARTGLPVGRPLSRRRRRRRRQPGADGSMRGSPRRLGFESPGCAHPRHHVGGRRSDRRGGHRRAGRDHRRPAGRGPGDLRQPRLRLRHAGRLRCAGRRC